MNYTKAMKTKVESIIKSIPISYYLKNNEYKVSLKNTQTSYHDRQNRLIVVSHNNLKKAVENMITEPSDKDLEKVLRGLTYHEVSHALLTPKDLKKTAEKMHASSPNYYIVDSTLANILEDERIETLLKSFYMLCNFEENKALILTPATEEQTKRDFTAFVFNAVRFGMYGAKPINDRYIKMVKNYTSISFADNLLYRFNQWLKELQEIFGTIKEEDKEQDQDNNEQEQEEQEQQGNDQGNEQEEEEQEQDQEENSSLGDGDQDQEEESEEDQEEEQGDTQEDTQAVEEDNELSSEEAEDTIKKVLRETARKLSYKLGINGRKAQDINDFPLNKKLYCKLINLLSSKGAFGKGLQFIGAKTSGAFSTKAYIKDQTRAQETYKRFKAHDKSGALQSNSTQKKELVLLLDNSGSYLHNDFATNTILRTLIKIEKDINFKFRVIFFSNVIVEEDGAHRVSNSDLENSGSWALYNHSLQGRIAPNKDIVIMLTDGGIWLTEENANILNTSKTYIISDPENEDLFKDKTPKAHLVISEQYTEALEENIIRAFQTMFK